MTLWPNAPVYWPSMMMYSSMEKMTGDHDANIINLFNMAQKEGLIFNSKNVCHKTGICDIFQSVFSTKGYSPDPEKIQGISEMTPPQMKQELQSFLVRYCVPKFPHSSATFNIISGFRILTSPEVLQGALGDSTCPMQCSQPYPMPANRHLTGLTWFPIVLYYIK